MGLVERMGDTIRLFERLLPAFFGGASELLAASAAASSAQPRGAAAPAADDSPLLHTNRNTAKGYTSTGELPEDVAQYLQERLALDIRLYRQLAALFDRRVQACDL